MDTGTTCVTVNNRLAQALRAQDAQARLAAGQKVWSTPDIVAWSAWLQRGYESLVDRGHTDRVLLGAQQERLVWEDVIARDQTALPLLRPAAAAALAAQARQICRDWQLDDTSLTLHGGEETRRFLAWNSAFERQLNRHRWITRSDLPGLLLDALRDREPESRKRIELHGFDDLNPLQEALVAALRNRGHDVDVVTPTEAQRGECLRLAARDAEEECRLAADWARQRLDENPAARIALVSPGLADRRTMLERAMRQALVPADYLHNTTDTQGLVNVSLGRPLSTFPAVDAALLALRVIGGDFELAEASLLLRSAFIAGHVSEADARAALDLQLRRDGLPQLDLGRLAFRARGHAVDDHRHCPELSRRLDAVLTRRGSLPGNVGPSDWAGHILHLLEIIGWPGEYPLDSQEFQAAERFRRLLSEFAALENVLPAIDLRRAIREVRRMCEDTTFQPREADARVQVLGVLESAGLRFDAAWVLDMDDQAWPRTPAPNPLLPAGLQRERDTPHGSAARELRFARDLTERLQCIAPRVIFSHARAEGDRGLRASPLIADLPAIDAEGLGIDARQPLFAACVNPGPTDPLPPPVAMAPGAPLRGGSGLLGAQSACPFMAVARFRLDAVQPEEPTYGPDARLRGDLVHETLDLAWRSLRDSDRLQALDDAELDALLEDSIAQTLHAARRKRPDLFTEAFSALEQQRLLHLLRRWFDLERARAVSFRIECLEERRDIELAGLPLRLRADRIDRLANGDLLIIDYKTGRKPDIASWTSDRPLEPQVPLYCINAPSHPAGALLGVVRGKESERRFVGLTEQSGIVPGIDAYAGDEVLPDWQHVLDHWQDRLSTLAAEILRGEAAVAPQKDACKYCSYPSLCRVDQITVSEVADD